VNPYLHWIASCTVLAFQEAKFICSFEPILSIDFKNPGANPGELCGGK